jgi:serine/threonine protein kinase/Tfp pilus assembly protein PilF
MADVIVINKAVSHYKILEKLGSGGMGEVYKAEDTKLKRFVALKFLSEELTGDQRSKLHFLQEARAASILDHPYICTIHGIEETKEGQLFIIMAFYEGETLRHKLSTARAGKTKPLLIENILDISIQIAEGLENAHKKGIVHRDIKPSNVILTLNGQAKILDFGLAAGIEKNLVTNRSILSGTVAYMSPEQIEGEKIDARSDIWSFGVLLYEMLNGHLPFMGKSDQAIIFSILNENPESFENHLNIPEQLISSTLKCLKENPDARFQGFSEIVKELKNIKHLLYARPSESGLLSSEKTPSIAVLPFMNISDDPTQEYFCDGLTEELINVLTQIEGLSVVARTSSFVFKERSEDIRTIGHRLNVSNLLEGSIRKTDQRIRITVQLIKVSEGFHIWSETYERKLSNIFEIQDEITKKIVEKLKGELLSVKKPELNKPSATNLKAYQMFLKGTFFLNRMSEEDYWRAIGYFKKAISEDPTFALAHFGLSRVYLLLGTYFYLSPREAFPLSKDAASRALRIDKTLWEARHTLTSLLVLYEWKWEQAKEGFNHLMKINSSSPLLNYSIGAFWAVMGKLDLAIENLKKALQLDPLSTLYTMHMAVWLRRAKRFDEAREYLDKALELSPDNPWVYWMGGNILVAEKQFDEAIRMLYKAVDYSKKYPPILASLGWFYAFTGHNKNAKKIFNELRKMKHKRYVSEYLFAKICSALGEKDRAFQFLDHAFKERDPALIHIKTDEAIDNLRNDKRFSNLLRKMELDITIN